MLEAEFGEELIIGGWSAENEARYTRLRIATEYEGRLTSDSISWVKGQTDCTNLEILSRINNKPFAPLYISKKKELLDKSESCESFQKYLMKVTV